MQGSGNFSSLVPKNSSWKVGGKSRRAKSEVPWLRRNRASEPCPRPTKSRWFDRGTLRPRRKNYATGFWGFGRGDSISNLRLFFFGFGQGSNARFHLNQGVPDLALLDIQLTFQDKFFGAKIKKFPDPCIYSIDPYMELDVFARLYVARLLYFHSGFL
jgi:hypothetical protein